MGNKFKNVLRKKFNIDFELFASTINSYYDKYCSLFYDIEKYFGSYGSFYHIKLEKGFFIANPPYDELLLEKMVDKFINSVKTSKHPLTISYGLPNWGKYGVFNALEKTKNSEYLVYHRCMKYGEVFWYDKLNNNKILIPSHCRNIIQNEKGRVKHDVSNFDYLVNKYWVK